MYRAAAGLGCNPLLPTRAGEAGPLGRARRKLGSGMRRAVAQVILQLASKAQYSKASGAPLLMPLPGLRRMLACRGPGSTWPVYWACQ